MGVRRGHAEVGLPWRGSVPDWLSADYVLASCVVAIAVRLTWGFCRVWFERSQRKTEITLEQERRETWLALEQERRETWLALERERRKRPRQQLAEARPPPPRRPARPA